MEIKQNKIIDGRMQLGMVTDWIFAQDLSNEEKILYITIAKYSYQSYHRRSSNIQKEKFGFSKNTLGKYRKSLTDKGFIKWCSTKAYTAYEILEPKEIIDRFYFKGDVHYKTHNERPKDGYVKLKPNFSNLFV